MFINLYDKVQRSKPAQLPNGSNTTPKQSFRFEKKPQPTIEKPQRRSPSQQRRSKTSMELNPPSYHNNFPLNPATR